MILVCGTCKQCDIDVDVRAEHILNGVTEKEKCTFTYIVVVFYFLLSLWYFQTK